MQVPIGVEHESILISDRALSSDQGRKFVYVVKKGKTTDPQTKETVEQEVAETRNVVVGAAQPGGLRVIEKGLTPEDRVITTGLQRVRPGNPVKVIREGPTEPLLEGSTPAAAPSAPPAVQKSNRPLQTPEGDRSGKGGPRKEGGRSPRR